MTLSTQHEFSPAEIPDETQPSTQPRTTEPGSIETTTVLFPEARRRARRRRLLTGGLIILAVAVTATAVFVMFPRPVTAQTSSYLPPAVVPALTSCEGFIPKPVPSPNLLTALANEPDLLDPSGDEGAMTECEARMSAEQNINLGEPIGDLTAATTSRLMTLAEADTLIPTGVTDVLPPDRMVGVVTVHRTTGRYTPPGYQSEPVAAYTVVYDATSQETIASELGLNALG